jgi:hypothetical protein
MGASYVFDEMLPTHPSQAGGVPDALRRTELFSHGGKFWLRIGPVGQEQPSSGHYTVELPREQLALLHGQLGAILAP